MPSKQKMTDCKREENAGAVGWFVVGLVRLLLGCTSLLLLESLLTRYWIGRVIEKREGTYCWLGWDDKRHAGASERGENRVWTNPN